MLFNLFVGALILAMLSSVAHDISRIIRDWSRPRLPSEAPNHSPSPTLDEQEYEEEEEQEEEMEFPLTMVGELRFEEIKRLHGLTTDSEVLHESVVFYLTVLRQWRLGKDLIARDQDTGEEVIIPPPSPRVSPEVIKNLVH